MGLEAASVVQGWFLLTALQAWGSALQAFDRSLLSEKLYNRRPEEVSGLSARLFGQWWALLGLVRLAAVVWFSSRPLHLLALASFGASAGHFGLEAFVFGSTSPTNVAVLTNLLVSAFSFGLVGVCWGRLWGEGGQLGRATTKAQRAARLREDDMSGIPGLAGLTRVSLKKSQ